MVNSQVVTEISNALKIDERVEKIPNPIPVVEVGLKHSKELKIVVTDENSSALSQTLYTTPADMDFYIKNMTIGHIRDGTGTSTYYGVTGVINGQTVFLYKIPTRSGVAIGTPTNNSINFDNPIKLDRGTVINIVHDTNVAVQRTIVTIYGFIDYIK